MTGCFRQEGEFLVAEFVFKNFKDAFQFMTIVAELAESQNHHPDWRNVYNQVSIRLTTHDRGNRVTEKDWDLARSIELEPRIQGILGNL